MNTDLTLNPSPKERDLNTDLTLNPSPKERDLNTDLTLNPSPKEKDLNTDLTLNPSPKERDLNTDLTLNPSPKERDLNSHWVFKNFTVKDGLQSNEFNRYAYCKLQTGELAFGGVNGLNIFNPDDINDNVYEPNILFTGFKIGNKEVSIIEDSAILRKAIFATNQLHLNYTQNFLTFSFASTDYSSTKNNGFQYQLVGLDKDWLPATKLNEATYTNLDPGSYTFKVRGTNSDGVWSSKISSINIFISPPWWATWWFRSLVAMAVAGAAYGFYRYRLMQA
nr:hypothetical protein [Bacteroidota bacterium]